MIFLAIKVSRQCNNLETTYENGNSSFIMPVNTYRIDSYVMPNTVL